MQRRIDKKDVLVMTIMTVLYLILALVNLGDKKVPQTGYTPSVPGENWTVKFSKKHTINRINYYCGLGTDRDVELIVDVFYRVSDNYYDMTHVKDGAVIIEKKTGDTFKLKTIMFDPVETDQIIFQVREKTGGELKEIAMYDVGSNTPIKDFELVDYTNEGAKYLFDEQDLMPNEPMFNNGTYFDEIYHARTAYEHIKGIRQYENTHPPLGKLLIALGIELFGMTPFGWRIVGTVFGAFMIPIMYLFGLKVFKKRLLAFSCAFLMMFDFMHFTQTRIATIDVYVTFFIILMYYWMFDVYVNDSGENPKVYYRSFALSGIMFGIGIACKWIAFYASAGLFIILLMSKYNGYKPFEKIKQRKLRERKKEFVKKDFIKTFTYGMIFFVAIPATIYCASYIPVLKGEGKGAKLLGVVKLYIRHMYNYHSKEVLKATHPFSSRWYEWPIMKKPIWYYGKTNFIGGLKSTIVAFGNPLIWWVMILAFVVTIIIAKKTKDKRMFPIIIAAVCQYMPWMFVERTTFIYHFFSIVPFGIIMIVYIFEYLISNNKKLKIALYGYLGAVLVLFVIYYPVLSGMIISNDYIEKLKILKSWTF